MGCALSNDGGGDGGAAALAMCVPPAPWYPRHRPRPRPSLRARARLWLDSPSTTKNKKPHTGPPGLAWPLGGRLQGRPPMPELAPRCPRKTTSTRAGLGPMERPGAWARRRASWPRPPDARGVSAPRAPSIWWQSGTSATHKKCGPRPKRPPSTTPTWPARIHVPDSRAPSGPPHWKRSGSIEQKAAPALSPLSRPLPGPAPCSDVARGSRARSARVAFSPGGIVNGSASALAFVNLRCVWDCLRSASKTKVRSRAVVVVAMQVCEVSEVSGERCEW